MVFSSLLTRNLLRIDPGLVPQQMFLTPLSLIPGSEERSVGDSRRTAAGRVFSFPFVRFGQ